MDIDRLRAGFAWATAGLEPDPRRRGAAADEALLDVMLVAACADGEVGDAELTALARGVASLRLLDVHDPVGFEREVMARARAVIAEGPTARVARAAAALGPPPLRVAALRLAALVVFADREIADEEPEVLVTLANALGVDAGALAQIVSDAGRAVGG